MTKMIESVNAIAFDVMLGLQGLREAHPGSAYIENFDETIGLAIKGVNGLAILRMENLMGSDEGAPGFSPVGWAPSIVHACNTSWAVESGELRVSGKKLTAEQYIRWYRDVVEKPKAVSKEHVNACAFGVPYERLEAMPMAAWLLIANCIAANVIKVDKSVPGYPHGLIVPKVGQDGLTLDAAMVALLVLCNCGSDAGLSHIKVISSELVEDLILAAEVGDQRAFQF